MELRSSVYNFERIQSNLNNPFLLRIIKQTNKIQELLQGPAVATTIKFSNNNEEWEYMENN